MNSIDRRDPAQVLARLRAALATPADTDAATAATLVEDIREAEQRFTRISEPSTEIHLGRVDHEGSTTIVAAHSRNTLLQKLVSCCDRRWPHDSETPPDLNESPEQRLGEFQQRLPALTIAIWTVRDSHDEPLPDDRLETGRYCVLGTAHLCAATANQLDRWCSENSDGGPFVIARSIYGWFIPTREVASGLHEHIPEDLLAAMRFGRERGFDHILFDCDAGTIADLPVYDW
ncbi:hypothetical protein [Rhizorhabdus histidinilytica]|uniref:DUF5983 family protein n=1 Tax=Rhizorhabdus histidinilytica TaxID=439228 RepID=UPI001F27DABC|nr:hypothetical protein [Rhizorhabdus histidinilytica]